MVGPWQGCQASKLFFTKEGFSLRGGNHQHLVLLLDHHHCICLANLRADYHSASLQLQQVGKLKASQMAQAPRHFIQTFLGKLVYFTGKANQELSQEIVDGGSNMRTNWGQILNSSAGLHSLVSFLLPVTGYFVKCFCLPPPPPHPPCWSFQVFSSSYWLSSRGGWCAYVLSQFLSSQSSYQGHQCIWPL